MRRLLNVLLVLIAIVVVVAGAGVAYLFAAYPKVPAAENVTVQATPEKVARGEYLSKHVSGCVDCHAQRDWTKYAGPVIDGTLGRGGESFGDPDSAIKELYS